MSIILVCDDFLLDSFSTSLLLIWFCSIRNLFPEQAVRFVVIMYIFYGFLEHFDNVFVFFKILWEILNLLINVSRLWDHLYPFEKHCFSVSSFLWMEIWVKWFCVYWAGSDYFFFLESWMKQQGRYVVALCSWLVRI